MRRDSSRDSDRKRETASEPARRHLSFHDAYWDDLEHWIATDPRIAARVIRLTRETVSNPFEGIGKPERLKHLESTWSRRITEEHRLIYRVTANAIEIINARFHYSK